MNSIPDRYQPALAEDPGTLHRTAVTAMTVIMTALSLMTVFKVIDLDPDLLTLQLETASQEQVGAWFAVAALSVFGVYKAVGYIIAAGLHGWNGYRRAIESILATCSLLLLWQANYTGDVLAYGLPALVMALIARSVSEAIRRDPEPLG